MSRLVLPLLLALALAAGPAAAEEPGPAAGRTDTTEAVTRALAGLESSAERLRHAAVDGLVDLLPASRGPVVAALETADAAVRPLLVRVLVTDASSVAVEAVLARLERSEPIEATGILQALVANPAALAEVQQVWQEKPVLGQTPRARTLAALVRRVEAERLFLSRKSKTGSTGSYRGQYDVLLPHREEALDLCVAITLDRAHPVPGVYPSGVFEFLRPPRIHIPVDEVRSMAAHAFSELARPSDTTRLRTLDLFLQTLLDDLDQYGYGADRVELGETLSRCSDLLVALYLVQPETYRTPVARFLRDVRNGRWGSALTPTYRAIVLLRVGRYEEAVHELNRAMGDPNTTSQAGAHYNLACAYAQWGELSDGPERFERRSMALYHLERAVDHQWSDIGWMEEDRDLDPIRNTAQYRRLVKRVHEFLGLPEDD